MTTQDGTAGRRTFFTPELLASEASHAEAPVRGRLLIASCCSGSPLATSAVSRYRQLQCEAGGSGDLLFLDCVDKRFSDSETCVRLSSHVGGADAFLFQSLFDPTSDRAVDQNYVAFLIAARALRENGAERVTGVLPYLAYARQDKPTKFTRESTTARLMADLTIAAGVGRLIVWDPHCDQIRGFYGGVPVNALESLTLYIEEFRDFRGRDDVIAVAPDAGASKFVTHFGRALSLKCAIASKYRPNPEEVVVSEIIGDFAGKSVAIVLDDMISNAGTVHAIVKKLATEKGIREIYLGASHNLCVGKAVDRLRDMYENYNLKAVIVTNSIPQTAQFADLPFIKVRCLSDTLARTINRIHYSRSVSEVFYRPQ